MFNNDLLFDDVVTNTDKFTLSLWFVGDGTSYDPAVLTNKRWSSAANGLVLAQLNDSLKLQVGIDGEGSCCFVQLPYTPTIDTNNLQWNLLVVSVDKTQEWNNGEGFGVMNFGVYDANNNLHYGSVNLSGSRNDTIHTGLPWLINNDHAQTYNNEHIALIDELVIWDNSVFTPGSVAALGKAETSVTKQVTSTINALTPDVLPMKRIDYIGAKPNLSESEQKKEAFWQRRRQMEELTAEFKH